MLPEGVPLQVPLLPRPDESIAVEPLPSFNFHQPTKLRSGVTSTDDVAAREESTVEEAVMVYVVVAVTPGELNTPEELIEPPVVDQVTEDDVAFETLAENDADWPPRTLVAGGEIVTTTGTTWTVAVPDFDESWADVAVIV